VKRVLEYFILFLFLTFSVIANESTIKGKAVYTDNLTLPKDAKFEVTLEDVSLMDAPSVVIGQTTIDPAGQIPIAYTITFDDKKIVLGHRYAVRAKITQGDTLLYMTDTMNPVFTGNDTNEVELIMKRIYKIPESHVMQGLYKYMADAALFKECLTGKYYPVAFEADNVALEKAYLKDTNGSGEFLKVEIKGKVVKRPKMDGDGEEDTLLVERFIRTEEKKDCTAQHENVPIINNYWKLILLSGGNVSTKENEREAHILLKTGFNGVGELKMVTSCGIVMGRYKIEDQNIEIKFKERDISEEKTCKDKVTEDKFSDALTNAKYWKIKGETLQLLDDTDAVLAEFKAVYF
jgi:uncharacterized lipoprotein YbaY/heat shock protein HslJ